MSHSNLHNAVTSTIIEWIKTFGYFFSIFTFDYLNIPQEQLSILGILMVIDTITWISRQYRVEPRWITSHALWAWVLKKFVSVLIVYILALLGKGLWIPPEHFVEWGLSILIMAEGYSSIQNIYAVRTGILLPEYDVISIILKKLRDFILNKIDNLQPKWK